MKIAIVAPSCTLSHQAADRLQSLVSERGDCEISIHPQCFLSDGHFAGTDNERLGALREVMEDPGVDAVWFARGGYGANRIAAEAIARMGAAARVKAFLGYSDGGTLLASLYRAGMGLLLSVVIGTVLGCAAGYALSPLVILLSDVRHLRRVEAD